MKEKPLSTLLKNGPYQAVEKIRGAVLASDRNLVFATIGMRFQRNVKDWFSFMKLSETTIKTRESVLISRAGNLLFSAYIANTCLSRLRGLFAFPVFESKDALVLQPCSAVHTFGFNYSIDAIFLDNEGMVLKCVVMKPHSICMCWGAYSVVEFANGTVHRLGLLPGQQLDIHRNGASHE